MRQEPDAHAITLHIAADRDTVPMGRSVRVEAVIETGRETDARSYLLLPFVNGRRWGAHERPTAPLQSQSR
jgi:hypothetical protein